MNQRRPLRVLVIGQRNSFDQILAANVQCWGYEAVILPSIMTVLGEEGIEGDVLLCDLDEAFRISMLTRGRDTPALPIQWAKRNELWWPRVPFTIALSSHSVSRATLEQIGAIAFLHKPFEMGHLQRYLRLLQRLLSEELALPADNADPAAAGETARVLVVDDDVNIADAVRQCLVEEAGYEVAVAHDGLEAMEQYLSWHPHCIVTDLIMPWMNGYQLMRCLAARSHRVSPAFVVMSALTQLETPVNRSYLEGKTVAYVDKPFQIDYLLTTIQQVLLKVGAPLAHTYLQNKAPVSHIGYPPWEAGNTCPTERVS